MALSTTHEQGRSYCEFACDNCGQIYGTRDPERGPDGERLPPWPGWHTYVAIDGPVERLMHRCDQCGLGLASPTGD